MRRLAVLVLLVSLAGCSRTAPTASGTATPPGQLARLAAIRSGVLDLEMRAEDAAGKAGAGFSVSGPFSLAKQGALPIARLTVEKAPRLREPVTVVSTGTEAFIEVRGRAYRLPNERLEVAEGEGGELRLESWFTDVQYASAGTIDGVAVERVDAGLDPVRVLNDVAALARGFGASLRPVEGDEAQRLRRAVEDAHATLWTGVEDRLVRRMVLTVRFDVAREDDLRAALGSFAGARLTLEMSLRRPNEPVTVEAPKDPRPLSELGRS